MSSDLLTPAELADYLRVGLRTVHRWRAERRGPTACRVGHAIRYRRADVDAWLEDQRQEMPRAKGAV